MKLFHVLKLQWRWQGNGNRNKFWLLRGRKIPFETKASGKNIGGQISSIHPIRSKLDFCFTAWWQFFLCFFTEEFLLRRQAWNIEKGSRLRIFKVENVNWECGKSHKRIPKAAANWIENSRVAKLCGQCLMCAKKLLLSPFGIFPMSSSCYKSSLTFSAQKNLKIH